MSEYLTNRSALDSVKPGPSTGPVSGHSQPQGFPRKIA